MPLRQEGDYWYGDSPTDVWDYFVWYTRDSGQPVSHWRQAVCECGSGAFCVAYDEEEHYLTRTCTACDTEVVMFADEFADLPPDSEQAQPNPALLECICYMEEFEVVGVTAPFFDDLTQNSARTFYLGLRCIQCGCLGLYAEWNPRYIDHEAFLAML